MALPTQRKILKEDVKNAPSWIDRIIQPFNSFMESTYQLFDKNITYTDNIACQLKTITIQTLPSYLQTDASTFKTMKFSSTLKTKAYGIQMVKIVEVSGNYVPLVNTVMVNWYEVDGTIYIPFITGLKPNTKYNINLIVF